MTTKCSGILVPTETLRNALKCQKETVPLLLNDLDLCKKNSDANEKACTEKISNLHLELERSVPATRWTGLVTSFIAGALATSILVITIK